jgi:uncharacterized protein DUF6064
MQLPFTEDQFFDVFGSYNRAVWPVVVGLWLATLAYSVALLRGRTQSAALSALAAVHWAWSGVVYHAMFFATINAAAWLFGAMFAIEAAAFVWLGVVRDRLTFEWRRDARHGIALFFIAYSLAYPLLVALSGHQPPRAPLCAVPCPTTLFTTGLLLAGRSVHHGILIVPTLWALIGASAALTLGVFPDVMLLAAAICLIAYGLSPWLQPAARIRRPA